MLGRVHNFVLERYFVPYMLAVLDLAHLPSTEGHSTSNLRPECKGNHHRIPVTGVTSERDKMPTFRTNKTTFLVRSA